MGARNTRESIGTVLVAAGALLALAGDWLWVGPAQTPARVLGHIAAVALVGAGCVIGLRAHARYIALLFGGILALRFGRQDDVFTWLGVPMVLTAVGYGLWLQRPRRRAVS